MRKRENLTTENQKYGSEKPNYEDFALEASIDEKLRAKDEARKAPFSRIALWMLDLPITLRQALILGRIYSFQCSKFGDGDYHMSFANGASELNIDKRDFRKDLKVLVERGYLLKSTNGPRVPASYIVNESKCLRDAMVNGYNKKAVD